MLPLLGFLYGWLEEKDVGKGVQYGNAFAALKHTLPGDFNWSTLGEGGGFIKRDRAEDFEVDYNIDS